MLVTRQVRGDHAEVVQLLMQLGGKVRATSGALVDLQTTPLSRHALLSLQHGVYPTVPGL